MSDQSLLEAARRKEVGLLNVCGGRGICGKCRVQVIKGQVSEPVSEELEHLSHGELSMGFRLACKTYPESDLVVSIPPESMNVSQRLQVEGLEAPSFHDPSIHAYHVSMSTPSLSDLRGDDQRLIDALHQQHGVLCNDISHSVLQKLPHLLRSSGWHVAAFVREAQVISVALPGTRNLGVAVDLGTTKIAGYLVDLETGLPLSAKGVMNPQLSYGEDVVTRMVHAQKSSENANRLQQLVITAIGGLIKDLLGDTGLREDEAIINEVVIACNTAMHHLLLRLPVSQLLRAPHVPAVSLAVDITGKQLGLHIAEMSHVHLLPNVAGFVGGDHIAMLTAIDVASNQGPVLAIDIGTNTEISLIFKGIIRTVSCASGPAFEGAHISCGMRAARGAIEHISMSHEQFLYCVIQDVPPIGICGSGMFDALALLRSNGIVDRGGRLMDDHPLVRKGQNGLEVVLVDKGSRNASAVVITQKDIRELQLAKGAIRAGIEILLKDSDLLFETLDEIFLAGAFGSYLDISSAISIGMLPRIPVDRFRQVGNAAGMGARAVLGSKSKREEVKKMAREIRYVELAGYPGFQRVFMGALNFA